MSVLQGTSNGNDAGVMGINNNLSTNSRGVGVHGQAETGEGVLGETNSLNFAAVSGFQKKAESKGAGVYGESLGANAGVFGNAKGNGAGLQGLSESGVGVLGKGGKGDGVLGQSDQRAGVHGQGPTGGFFEGGSAAGVHAVMLGDGPAILAKGGGGANFAGFFDGNVNVTKTVTTFDVFIAGSDCAEEFDIISPANVEPGTVMVIGDDARLIESHRAYDKRVAGIVSGAGDLKPGIVLGKDASSKDRVPLALIGKVFCRVDATYAPIEVGDLLTTSPTRGHAMKAEDPLKSFGAVVGKALAPLREGRSLLPILVALQ
jgi:hypothetical protein